MLFSEIYSMKEVARHLIETIEKALPLLHDISDDAASIKPGADKWSAKEIIGHLIDSANNNQQKFVRAMQEDGVHFPPYEQDWWVSCQHYNEENREQLLEVWKYMNLHLAHIMQHIPANTLQHNLYIGNTGPYKLEFIVTDYVEHLKHHLKQILPAESFLNNSFEMVY
jgi:hypothetical protein